MKILKIDDIKEVNIKLLLKYLLNEPWHKYCEIIPDYMPKNPSKDTRPSVAIRFNNQKEYLPYLRYSKGPIQGYFWDIYGDDFLEVELAIVALSKASAPIDVSPITFKFDLQDKVKNG
jgi:hypothetical protein